MEQSLTITPKMDAAPTGSLEFSKIDVNPEYCKKWNIRMDDFICLTKNGVLLRNTLYRIGGLMTPKLGVDQYFMLIKHEEAFYDDEITTDPLRKPHLKMIWAILDKEGNEKVECKDSIYYPSLVKNSIIYCINHKYYNIETGEFYCDTRNEMESEQYLFLENDYDKDESRRGVMKIDKKTGKYELFPKK